MSMERTDTGYKSVGPAIKPTPGRVVWYCPSRNDNITRHGDAPLAALVAYVWNDAMVNLMVIDANGFPHSRTSVLLSQEGAPAAETLGGEISYCTWMPYQRGQAAKAEALEKQLAGNIG